MLAGVAVAALLTAIQTYLQQQHDADAAADLHAGSSASSRWPPGPTSLLILPYVVVSAGLLLAHRRLLDVLRVGEEEAGSLGVDVARLRLIVVLAATLGTAAAVSVSGLIGFVGIIVPHTVRLTAGASYRIVLPVSMIGGAAFLILADVAARTVQAPAEVPIGVITALVGAPFFLFVLRLAAQPGGTCRDRPRPGDRSATATRSRWPGSPSGRSRGRVGRRHRAERGGQDHAAAGGRRAWSGTRARSRSAGSPTAGLSPPRSWPGWSPTCRSSPSCRRT